MYTFSCLVKLGVYEDLIGSILRWKVIVLITFIFLFYRPINFILNSTPIQLIWSKEVLIGLVFVLFLLWRIFKTLRPYCIKWMFYWLPFILGFFVLVNPEMDLIEKIYKEFFFPVHYWRKICLHDWVIMKRGYVLLIIEAFILLV